MKTQDYLNIRNGESHTRHLTNPAEHIKDEGGSWFDVLPDGIKQGGEWWNDAQGIRRFASKSSKRKAASAQIAKIPFPLARHIARCFFPAEVEP